MGRITTNVGLFSGFPIQDTVDKLMALQAQPRDDLKTRTTTLTNQQTAVQNLAAQLLSLQFSVAQLSTANLFDTRSVTSSNPSVLTATATGTPALGTHTFLPVQTVQAQQFLSSKLASDTAPLGVGQFSFRFGGFIDAGTSLDIANNGEGIERGKIKITDRSGASAEIDLSLARTVDDVLDAINNATGIKVTAEAHGDSIRLIDKTGQTAGNLKVEEVDGGDTAASLGLGGINVAASQVDGQDLVKLFNDLKLDRLNQGLGVRFDNVQSDLQINFRDGTSQTVDFHRSAVAGTKALATTTAVNGPNARVTFTATQAGSASAGVQVSFVDNATITKGNETVAYDAQNKTLVFQIDAGNTTADDIAAALGRNATASAAFTAVHATGGDGSGLVDVSDTATTTGPQSTATTAGTISSEAKILFTAVHGGTDFDDVTIQFVDNPGVTKGNETVAYDDSNPNDKRLVFQISAGNTDANDITNALNNDPTASQVFTAARAAGSTGQGLVSTADTALTSGGAIAEPVTATNEQSIGDVLNTLNSLDPTRLKAEISADGERIVLTDLSTDNGGTFGLTQLHDSHVLDDLGLTSAASGDTISGRRVLSGFKTALLANLNGGKGITGLGLLSLTDRSGASATVDLSSAETLQDVIDAINAAGIGVAASVNSSRTGLQLTDTTGSTSGNLIVANGDGTTTTADRLGIAANVASNSVTGTNLRLQTVNEQTTLASLNGGSGVRQGTFTITDRTGTSATISLTSSIKTVGDLIDEIGRHGLQIQARVNDAGDGIVLVDTAGTGGPLKVTEGNSKTASDLHLLGGETTVTVGNETRSAINGSSTVTITTSATDSLNDLITKINAAGGFVTATKLNDGSSVKPFRFTLTSQVAGSAGELLIDNSLSAFNLQQTVKPQDALLVVGGNGDPSTGILAASSTNTFSDVVSGLSVNVLGASTSPVSVTVGQTSSSIATTLQAIVQSYNSLNTNIKNATAFDADTNTRAILQGDATVLRVQTQLSDLFSRRIFGAGSIQSLASLGLTFSDDGSLQFDQDKLNAAFTADPNAVKSFFTTDKTGFAARFKTLSDQLAGGDHSALIEESNSLGQTIANNNDRIDFLTARLDVQRQQLLDSFNRMESAIAQMQSNSSALSQIAQVAASIGTFASSNSSSSSSSSSS